MVMAQSARLGEVTASTLLDERGDRLGELVRQDVDVPDQAALPLRLREHLHRRVEVSGRERRVGDGVGEAAPIVVEVDDELPDDRSGREPDDALLALESSVRGSIHRRVAPARRRRVRLRAPRRDIGSLLTTRS
jgi:hypothetical protein